MLLISMIFFIMSLTIESMKSKMLGSLCVFIISGIVSIFVYKDKPKNYATDEKQDEENKVDDEEVVAVDNTEMNKQALNPSDVESEFTLTPTKQFL